MFITCAPLWSLSIVSHPVCESDWGSLPGEADAGWLGYFNERRMIPQENALRHVPSLLTLSALGVAQGHRGVCVCVCVCACLCVSVCVSSAIITILWEVLCACIWVHYVREWVWVCIGVCVCVRVRWWERKWCKAWYKWVAHKVYT